MNINLLYNESQSSFEIPQNKSLTYLYELSSRFSNLHKNNISLFFKGKLVPNNQMLLVEEFFSDYESNILINIKQKKSYNEEAIVICKECKNSKNDKLFYCRVCNSIYCYDCSLEKKHKKHKMFSMQNKTFEECVNAYQNELLFDIENLKSSKNIIIEIQNVLNQIDTFKEKLIKIQTDVKGLYSIDYDEIRKDIYNINEENEIDKKYSLFEDMSKLNVIEGKLNVNNDINLQYSDVFKRIKKVCLTIEDNINELSSILRTKSNNYVSTSPDKMNSIKLYLSSPKSDKKLFLPKLRTIKLKGIPKFLTTDSSEVRKIGNSPSLKKVRFNYGTSSYKNINTINTNVGGYDADMKSLTSKKYKKKKRKLLI